MKPKYVTIKNFKRYGNEEIKVPLDGNSVKLITGDNGAGKSSIMDAVIWCLYGKSSSSVEKIVNRINKKNCKVEFEFLSGKDIYCIIRYRKHDDNGNDIIIFKNKENITQKKAGDNQFLINEIVGITYESMVASVMFSEEKYSSFLRAKGAERLRIFDGILSLKQINKWSDVSKKLKKPIEDKINELQEKDKKIVFGIETIESNIDDYRNKSKVTLLNLKKEKEKIGDELENLGIKISEISAIDITEEKEKISNYNSIKSKNLETESQINEEANKLKDLDDLYSDINKIRTYILNFGDLDIEEAKEKLKDLRKARDNNVLINNKIAVINSGLKNTDELENIKKVLFEEFEEIQAEIKTIEHDNLCPTCNQSLDGIDNNILEEKKKEHNQKNNDILDVNIKIDDVIKENKKKNEEIEKLKLELVSEEVLSFTEDDIERIKEKKSKLNELNSEHESSEKWNNEIEERINKLRKNIEELTENSNYNPEFLDNLEKEKDNIYIEMDELVKKRQSIIDQSVNVYDKALVEGWEEKIKILAKGRVSVKRELTKKRKIAKHYDYLLTLFSNKDSGLKKHIISKMIALFNDKVNEYIPLYFDDIVTVEFNKSLTETITVNDQIVDFEEFSSGEKKRLELAVAMSMFMLVKTFYSESVNFISFDEILDGALDKKGIEATVNLIEHLGEDNSIFIVSHRDNLKDYFQNRIYIRKGKDGFTKVRLGD